MEKFISYEKMSKKQKKAICSLKRRSWNEINPVTRKSENKKIYNRKKKQNYSFDDYKDNDASFSFAHLQIVY